MEPAYLSCGAQHIASCPQDGLKTSQFRMLGLLNIHRAAVVLMKRFLISFFAATLFDY